MRAMEEVERQPRRVGRTRAFRLVAGILGALGIVLTTPSTVASFVDEGEAVHRIHNLATTIGFGALFGAAGGVVHVALIEPGGGRRRSGGGPGPTAGGAD